MVVLGLTVLNTYILFAGWWFGTFGLFFHILGISSSQLTNSYFSEGLINHQPVIHTHKLVIFHSYVSLPVYQRVTPTYSLLFSVYRREFKHGRASPTNVPGAWFVSLLMPEDVCARGALAREDVKPSVWTSIGRCAHISNLAQPTMNFNLVRDSLRRLDPWHNRDSEEKLDPWHNSPSLSEVLWSTIQGDLPQPWLCGHRKNDTLKKVGKREAATHITLTLCYLCFFFPRGSRSPSCDPRWISCCWNLGV